jgi:hypothetical protein
LSADHRRADASIPVGRSRAILVAAIVVLGVLTSAVPTAGVMDGSVDGPSDPSAWASSTAAAIATATPSAVATEGTDPTSIPTATASPGTATPTTEVGPSPRSATIAKPPSSANPAATATPTLPKPPTTPKTSGRSVSVGSIPDLLAALADNSVGLIVVANGTYHVSPASSEHADALWIGSRFASRTRPITVRAATRGNVTFDGGGATSFSCIAFSGGAHDQTWDGFNCAHGQATNTGIVTFGGYAGEAGPHHITMRHIAILSSCTGRSTSVSSPTTDHAFYISYAVGGPHDLTFEDISVNGAGHLSSAFHFFHSNATNQNAWNVTVRRLRVTGTQQAIILWDPTLRNITFDTATISNALDVAIRYETEGAKGVRLTNITSTGSGNYGFYSSQGSHPAGVTFTNDSLH